MRKIRVCLTGGLGNQLFQYAFAFSFLRDGDIIELDVKLGSAKSDFNGTPEILNFIDDTNGRVLSSNYWFFRKKLFNLLLRLSSIGDVKKRKKLISLLYFLLKTSKEKSWVNSNLLLPNGTGYDKDLMSVDSFNLAIGYFQSYRWLIDSGRMKDFADLSVRSIPSTKWIDLSKKEKPLVVQIRLGDYQHESDFGLLSKNYFNHAIEKVMDASDIKSIWLFSNDITAARELISDEYSSLVREIDSNLTAAETLQIMRLGAAYVISNSTFGWWGAFLSHSKNPIVVCPYPWFVELESPLEMCPPNWLTINPWL
jgi:hypothetical protein